VTDINKRIEALTDRKKELLARLVSKTAERRIIDSAADEAENRPAPHALADE
jgi:hypothetical protein